MKNILKTTTLALVCSMALTGCIKETFPTDSATSGQVSDSPTAVEAIVNAIPVNMTYPYSVYGRTNNYGFDFGYPGMMCATDAATGDVICSSGDEGSGYDWFTYWQSGILIGPTQTVCRFPWNCYYTFIKSSNDVVGLLAGVVSVGMIITQGATYLQMRTVGELHLRTRATAQVAALVTLVCFALAGVWVMYGIDGYVVKSTMDHYAASNPLNKEVVREAGAWLVNFNNTPILWAIPALGVVLPLLTILTARMDKAAWAFVFSSLTLACIILTAGIAMFPFVMPSSTMMNASLTMWDATSSQLTLNVMTWVAVVLVPIILLYTAWCYWKMFGRITKEDIERNTHSLY